MKNMGLNKITLNGSVSVNFRKLISIRSSSCESSILSVCKNNLDALISDPSSLSFTSSLIVKLCISSRKIFKLLVNCCFVLILNKIKFSSATSRNSVNQNCRKFVLFEMYLELSNVLSMFIN